MTTRNKDDQEKSLLGQIAGPEQLNLTGLQETAWIEVIQKMEEVYSDLIKYDVDLEQKNAQLEDAQQFISSVLSSMSDALIVLDAKGNVRQVNYAVLGLTGFEERELIGKPVNDILMEGDDKVLSKLISRQARGVRRDTELSLRHKDGDGTDPVAISCSTLIDHQGRSAGVVLIGRPVGELRRAYQALNKAHADLKKAQQQIVQSEKMASLGRLVAGVAHELNNPISFVYGNIHSLERYRKKIADYLVAIHDDADRAEIEALRQALKIDKVMADLGPLIEGTMEGAERVSDIVKSLRRLSFSGDMDAETINLTEVVKTGVQWAERGSKKPATISINLPETLLVSGIAGQLHQVIVNMIENAIGAGADDQDIMIDVHGETDGETIKIAIADNGPGIGEEDILRVFDPFFTTKAVGQGTGLGLWISYGIIRDHGGDIEAGNGVNGGAVFTITLPKAEG